MLLFDKDNPSNLLLINSELSKDYGSIQKVNSRLSKAYGNI